MLISKLSELKHGSHLKVKIAANCIVYKIIIQVAEATFSIYL